MTLRRAGITLPLFSLRGEEDAGIGEIEDLAGLVDWAAANGQRLIALLPLGDLGPGEYSPYNALSSFAIDPLLVRPSRIAELRGVSLPERAAAADGTRVDRERARAWKEPLFARAFATFEALGPDHPRKRAFAEFRARADSWLADYSLFRALLEAEGNRWWKEWPAALREREPAALAEARTELADRIRFFEYLQFVAAEAWERVHREARERDVWLMGDLPFAPSENSADVWSNPELFDPTRCAGAPPDAFSETGQRWGLPMYRWSALRASHWRLLRLRARRMAELYDLFRVDHVVGLFRTFGFRGEEPCGFDPAEEADQRAQGREILEIMLAEAAPAGVVAEDLGTIPKFVPETLSGLDVPGYQVLRWQRVDERVVDPLEYPECSIATTGTYDTDTLVEWWESLALEERAEYAEAVGCAVDAPEPVRRLAILERLYRSPSRYVVPPVQDLFGWRERINTPATVGEGNWRYRLPLTIDGLSRDPAMQRDCDKLVRLIDGSGRLRKMDPSHRDGRSARPTAARPGELAMDDFKTGSVRANGLDFHYLEAGEGPLVLCLHGFPDHARSFRFQLPALAAAGFRAVAPYMRGYAPTDVPDGPYQSAALAKDAVSLIDALSPKVPAFVFGHDWGAIAAYGAAIVAPNRVKKIATAAVPHGPQLMEAILTSYAQMRRSFYIFMFQLPTAERSVSHNNFEFLDRLWADWSPGWTLPSAEMAALKATFQKPGVLSAALAYYRATFNPALQWPELAELQGRMMMEPIQVPGLVFHGQKDGCIGVETLEGMETVFPKGLAKMVIPDAGHFLHQEKPEAVNEPLLAFLKS